MSLELAVTENTATLKQLISTLQGMGKLEIVTVGDTPKSADPKAAAKPAAKPAATPKTVEEATTKQAEKTEESQPKAEEAGAPEVTYDALKVKVLELAGQDRDKVLEVLSRFGVTTAKDLKPEQYATALADFERVLAGGLA